LAFLLFAHLAYLAYFGLFDVPHLHFRLGQRIGPCRIAHKEVVHKVIQRCVNSFQLLEAYDRAEDVSAEIFKSLNIAAVDICLYVYVFMCLEEGGLL